jgi:predicted restriction endonuclease
MVKGVTCDAPVAAALFKPRLKSLFRQAAILSMTLFDRLGQPIVPNGISLTKIHHAAFDVHLIGIDPDYRLHVSDRLLGQHDGPMLEALKRLNGGTIRAFSDHSASYPAAAK